MLQLFLQLDERLLTNSIVLNILVEYWLFGILLVVIAIYRNYRARFKGFVGEKSIAIRLNRLNPDKYLIINNLVLTVNGRTTQIDHLVISDFGLFVIETKNYIGWIMGGEHSEYWTQVIFKRKEKFYNPIRQNRGHIVALKHYLQEFPNIAYVPIVVFSNRCTIKVETDALVIYTSELIEVVREYSEVNLLESEKESIFETINSVNVSHTYSRKTHIKSIKQKIKKRNRSIEQGKCPNCGRDLVKRSGKFGRFIGCSNYPQCRFTINN